MKMQLKNSGLLLILLSLLHIPTHAQGLGMLKGKLIDDTGEPAVYTKVILKDSMD